MHQQKPAITLRISDRHNAAKTRHNAEILKVRHNAGIFAWNKTRHNAGILKQKTPIRIRREIGVLTNNAGKQFND